MCREKIKSVKSVTIDPQGDSDSHDPVKWKQETVARIQPRGSSFYAEDYMPESVRLRDEVEVIHRRYGSITKENSGDLYQILNNLKINEIRTYRQIFKENKFIQKYASEELREGQIKSRIFPYPFLATWSRGHLISLSYEKPERDSRMSRPGNNTLYIVRNFGSDIWIVRDVYQTADQWRSSDPFARPRHIITEWKVGPVEIP